MEPKIYLIKDMAQALGITEKAVRRRIEKRRGIPAPMRVGGRVCWPREVVNQWIKQLE